MHKDILESATIFLAFMRSLPGVHFFFVNEFVKLVYEKIEDGLTEANLDMLSEVADELVALITRETPI